MPIEIITFDIVVVVLPVLRASVVRRVDVYGIDFSAVGEKQRLQSVVVFCVDNSVERLVAATFHLPSRNEAGVDGVTELCDNYEVSDRSRGGLRRFDGRVRLERCNTLVSLPFNRDDPPQLRVRRNR